MRPRRISRRLFLALVIPLAQAFQPWRRGFEDPAVSSSSLPAAEVELTYSIALAATGGTTPYSWSASGVPAGLTFSSSGVLSGTPTAPGTSSITFTVTDSVGARGSRTLALTVSAAAAATAVSITTGSPLPGATVGTAYSEQLAATGGSGPYTFAITSGSVPAGLTLSSAGLLAGTPTTAGGATFAVQATNSTSVTSAATTFTVTVSAAADAGAALANDSYPRYGGMEIGSPFNYGASWQQWMGTINWCATSWYLGYGSPNGYNYQQIAQNSWTNGQANGIEARITPYSNFESCVESLSDISNNGWGSATIIDTMNAANWWLRASYPSGAIVSGGYADNGYVNGTAGGPSYTYSSSNYTVNEFQTFLEYNFLTQGNASSTFGEADTMPANTYLCGTYHDNQYGITRNAGAWEWSTTSYAVRSTAITPYLQAMYPAQKTAWESYWTNSVVPSGQSPIFCGNVDFGPLYANGSMSMSDITGQGGLYDVPFLEELASQSWSIDTSYGFAGMITAIIGQEACASADGAVYTGFSGGHSYNWSSNSQGSWSATDWQWLRYMEATCLMRGTGIVINGSDGSYAQFEFQSDTKNGGAGGFSSSPVPGLGWLSTGSGTLDPPQSSAQFASGIWARHYPGGIAIVNPYGNAAGTVTITVGAGGMIPSGTYRQMPYGGYSDSSVNTGATITADFSLAPGDARILVAI